MFIYLLLIVVVCARYQFLNEQDVLDVITVRKEEALEQISSTDGPSYIITKQRHKFLFSTLFSVLGTIVQTLLKIIQIIWERTSSLLSQKSC